MIEYPSWWDSLPATRHIHADWTELAECVGLHRDLGCDIVLANGVFDLLHPGHILKIAGLRRKPADFVILSLDTDAQVRADRGRPPRLHWRERAPLVASIAGVDAVTAHGAGVGELVALVALLAPVRWHRRDDSPEIEAGLALDGLEVVRSPRNGSWSSTALATSQAI